MTIRIDFDDFFFADSEYIKLIKDIIVITIVDSLVSFQCILLFI